MPSKLLLLLVPAVLGAPRIADACSPPRCPTGELVPARGAVIPANAPGLYWRPMAGDRGDPSQVLLARAADPDTAIPLTATALDRGDFLLVPDAPLTASESYVIVDRSLCDGTQETGPTTAFSVAASTPLPTTLGALRVSLPTIAPLTVPTSSGSCVAEVTASQATVLLDLDPETRPWAKLLHFTTYVDGAVWGGSTSLETEQHRAVYQLCASSDHGASGGLRAGDHEVRIEARLPGTALVLASNTATVTLDCDAHGRPRGGDDASHEREGGCSAGGSVSLAWIGLAALLIRRRR